MGIDVAHKHFLKVLAGIDVAPVLSQLDAHPELWNSQSLRKAAPGSPHSQMSDIWVRYNDPSRIDLANREAFNDEHIPVWYPAWKALPALRPLVLGLATEVQAEMIGGVLITRIPPGEGIAPHVDRGWHVDYYDKIYLSLRSAPGADFVCEHEGRIERLNPHPGDVYLFDNRKRHWVENNSDEDRITLIICLRTEMFGRMVEENG